MVKEVVSGQPPNAPPDMQEQADVPQYLELLPDFIFHVPIAGMELFQFAGMGVDVVVGEFFR